MKEILSEIGDDLVNAIRVELQKQGHVNTGNLFNSITYNISEFAGDLTLTVLADEVDYASAINDGFRPKSLPNIDAIEEWVRQRGIRSEDDKINKSKNPERRLAFAIAQAIMREGSPTSGAYEFTSNTKRRGFANRPFGSRKIGIQNKIVEGMTVELEISLDSITKEI